MLYLDVNRVLKLRGIGKPQEFIVKLGFAPATARNMLRGSLWRVDLAHFERLCLALNCTPNDLIEWQPPENQADADAQALSKLRRDKQMDVSKMLNSLPIEQFEQIAGILQDWQTKQK